jgi:SAM-dependent methyltransferase
MVDVAAFNSEQREFWGGVGGERWVAQQNVRDAMLGDFGRAVLLEANARAGEVVIDVGCGCGETTVALAQAVGENGAVTAVDISKPILREAESQLASFPNARVVLADAATFSFPTGEADLVFSRFGVMFFGDPRAAFMNLRKAMKPGGRLVFACWRSPKENTWLTAPAEAISMHFPIQPPPDPDAPSPFAFADPDKVSRILTDAGFTRPAFIKIDQVMDLASGSGIEGAVKSAMEFGPVARTLDGAGDDLRRVVGETLRTFFKPRLVDGRIELAAAVWIVIAKPA